jgi:hypothetical protein
MHLQMVFGGKRGVGARYRFGVGGRIVGASMKQISAALCLTLLLTVYAAAEQPPATQPASSKPSYHAAVIPPGFHAITASDHTVFCRPQDDQWIQSALAALPPATRPTTMPSDLIASIAQKRGQVKSDMMRELDLKDGASVDDMFDKHILPILTKLQSLKSPVFFMVVSRQDLAQLMAVGWSDPRYHYLRFAHDVDYEPGVVLSIENRVDDLVIWVDIEADKKPAEKQRQFINEVSDFDTGYLQSISDLSQEGIGNVMDQFIHERAVDPLKLGPTVEWFAHGVAAVYSIKYKTELTGGSRPIETEALERGDWRNPLHSQPLNLVEPLDTSTMQKKYVIVYRESLFHKAASIIAAWVAKGGDDVLAKSLPALRAKSPTTPADLINAIKQSTGVDLTPAMLPNYSDSLPQL